LLVGFEFQNQIHHAAPLIDIAYGKHKMLEVAERKPLDLTVVDTVVTARRIDRSCHDSTPFLLVSPTIGRDFVETLEFLVQRRVWHQPLCALRKTVERVTVDLVPHR